MNHEPSRQIVQPHAVDSEMARLLIALNQKIEKLGSEIEMLKQQDRAWRDQIEEAFVDQDFQKHYEFHREIEDKSSQFKAIKLETYKKLVSGGIFSFMALVGYSLWYYVKMKINQ